MPLGQVGYARPALAGLIGAGDLDRRGLILMVLDAAIFPAGCGRSGAKATSGVLVESPKPGAAELGAGPGASAAERPGARRHCGRWWADRRRLRRLVRLRGRTYDLLTAVERPVASAWCGWRQSR